MGGVRALRADVRVVAATNRDLGALLRERAFREDLYYRLNGVTIEIPPLRVRREDILPAAEHFLRHFAIDLGRDVADFSAEARSKLEDHDWTGNVRELRNAVERAVLVAPGPVILPEDLVLGGPGATRTPGRLFTIPPEGLNLDDLERDLLVQALERAEGRRGRAGELLGMTRDQVHYRIRKFGLREEIR